MTLYCVIVIFSDYLLDQFDNEDDLFGDCISYLIAGSHTTGFCEYIVTCTVHSIWILSPHFYKCWQLIMGYSAFHCFWGQCVAYENEEVAALAELWACWILILRSHWYLSNHLRDCDKSRQCRFRLNGMKKTFDQESLNWNNF